MPVGFWHICTGLIIGLTWSLCVFMIGLRGVTLETITSLIAIVAVSIITWPKD